MKAGTQVHIDTIAKRQVQASVEALQAHLKADHCIYGVNTGFGASADSRTNRPDTLQAALLQMQHIGIMPSMNSGNKNVMPEAWVRGAMAIRINSLLRGHSAVRWEVLERLVGMLNNNAIPCVPLRGSISASGDLSPLSYIAGAVTGHPGIFCFIGEDRQTVTSREALASCGLQPVEFKAKEVLGLINGTSVSCSVATQVVSEASMLAQFSQALTAMAVEVAVGSAEPFDPWVAGVTRPHPGQKEVAGNIWFLLGDSSLARDRHAAPEGDEDHEHVGLRQDRYPLRTSPQWIGPQIEDLDLAISQLGVECNSTTDNPLIDTTSSSGQYARIMHAGNFQAMHVTAAMEKTRGALQNIGKLMFQQLTEMVNYCTAPLPPNLASDCDTSLSYTMKAVDIAAAAYCSELGVLAAGNVGSHVQCAEDRNQAVNSLALISARQADEMNDVLMMLMANYVYVLCQAVDLRVMLLTFTEALETLVKTETASYFKGMIGKKELRKLGVKVFDHVKKRFDETMREDSRARFNDIFYTATSVVMEALSENNPRPSSDPTAVFSSISLWRQNLTHKALALYKEHREEFVAKDMPAAQSLGRTRILYEFVRKDLNVPMHRGQDDLPLKHGEQHEREAQVLTTGAMITRIYEALRDGRMAGVVMDMFEGIEGQ
ncbi:phenylalanine ammonia-lyase [Tricharina praecox]|uniref:phenylalanine ammonia-lyase n=1 Tax=Tricharina praecox TaxID=43433 RepID=UPI002220C5C6|nr:phenylalanine ammonia-lyase [Tricharina praecox]KAI5841624.1 phenylalanine ammonia-lyase [Tricharina praecox]